MPGFQCPYCSMIMPISSNTKVARYPSFSCPDEASSVLVNGYYTESCIEISFYLCPNCGEYSILVKGKGEKVSDINTIIRPKSLAQQFPNYIPEAIRQDYEEACAIVNLSPKASATLARRCLQGMIRDFFQISKNTLYQEIDAIKSQIPSDQWAVLDGVRRIGNIGAHMEKDINLIIDIEPSEAKKLIKLIELLIKQWYIDRYNQQQLYADIIGIDKTKQSERKKNE